MDNKAELTFGAVGKGRAVDLFIDNYSDYSILINAGQYKPAHRSSVHC